ncbi:MAG TPA: alpha-amylase family glycosyl hydrolase [Hyphomicrobiaceae bacterium]|nr:alpha-amylase family glycosyl hydrolase [Hyphomicrobiaceae bacterium]
MAFGRAWASLRLLGAVAALLSTGGAEPHALIAFETQGRDAWTWRKEIALSVADAACDEVTISSPAASLVRRPQSGHVVASMPLVAGDNSVSAECWKAGVRRGETVRQHWVVRLRDAPTAHLRVVMRDDGVTLDASASEPARSRPTPITRYSWRAGERNPGPLAMPAEGMTVALPAPFVDGEYHVSLTIADATGRTDKATVMLRVHEGKVRRLDGPGAAEWIGNAVIYGVMLSAFEPPRLPAVTARLDALKRLGINTLWLSPITRSAPGDFGYAVTGHFALRADLGSEADLRALVEAAHLRDIRVILDFVPNHLSDHHPYYLSASRLGSASPYYDFFARTPSGEATHYFNWSNLKNLNYGNPEVRQMMIEAFAYWVRAFDIDGFRVDAAWGPRERTPGFWPRLQQELRRIKPDLCCSRRPPRAMPTTGALASMRPTIGPTGLGSGPGPTPSARRSILRAGYGRRSPRAAARAASASSGS